MYSMMPGMGAAAPASSNRMGVPIRARDCADWGTAKRTHRSSDCIRLTIAVPKRLARQDLSLSQCLNRILSTFLQGVLTEKGRRLL